MLSVDESDFDILLSHDVRPAPTLFGETVTPGHNAMGSWTTILATPLSADHHAIEVFCQDIGGTNGVASETLLDIGIDPAGGTAFQPIIPYLMASYAGPMNGLGPGCSWFFPVRFPAGCTIGGRSQVNNVALPDGRVAVNLYRAHRPQNFRYGTHVVTFGQDTVNSRGTAVTASITGTPPTYTQIGGAVAAPTPWFWQVSASPSNANTAVASAVYFTDLAIGDATTKHHVMRNVTMTSTAENLARFTNGGRRRSAVGDLVYARVWASGGATDMSAIVHGVCG